MTGVKPPIEVESLLSIIDVPVPKVNPGEPYWISQILSADPFVQFKATESENKACLPISDGLGQVGARLTKMSSKAISDVKLVPVNPSNLIWIVSSNREPLDWIK